LSDCDLLASIYGPIFGVREPNLLVTVGGPFRALTYLRTVTFPQNHKSTFPLAGRRTPLQCGPAARFPRVRLTLLSDSSTRLRAQVEARSRHAWLLPASRAPPFTTGTRPAVLTGCTPIRTATTLAARSIAPLLRSSAGFLGKEQNLRVRRPDMRSSRFVNPAMRRPTFIGFETAGHRDPTRIPDDMEVHQPRPSLHSQ